MWEFIAIFVQNSAQNPIPTPLYPLFWVIWAGLLDYTNPKSLSLNPPPAGGVKCIDYDFSRVQIMAKKKYAIAHTGGHSGDDYHLGWHLLLNGVELFCCSMARQPDVRWVSDTVTHQVYPEGIIVCEGLDVLDFLPAEDFVLILPMRSVLEDLWQLLLLTRADLDEDGRIVSWDGTSEPTSEWRWAWTGCKRILYSLWHNGCNERGENMIWEGTPTANELHLRLIEKWSVFPEPVIRL